MPESDETRHGDWIETFTGRRFWVLDARPGDIDILDIAHALSCLNRYTGHSVEPLSIAQHSVNVALILPRELQLWGLLHDAAEAYLNDIARPLKHLPEMAAYREAEARLMGVICDRFGLDREMPDAVKRADNIILKAEAKLLIPSRGETWSKWFQSVPDMAPNPLVKITPTWDWFKAEERFLRLFEHLNGGLYL